MITEDYVSFETAKLLKEKGFDEECCRFWEYEKANNKDDTDGISLSECNVYLPLCNSKIDYLFKDKLMSYGYSAPTLQMAMKWLREKKGIAVIPVLSSILDNEKFLWDIKIVVAKTNDSYSQGWVYETQESACETAIKYCLENLI